MNNQNPIDGQLTIIDSEGNEKWEYIQSAVSDFNNQCGESCEGCEVSDCPDRN